MAPRIVAHAIRGGRGYNGARLVLQNDRYTCQVHISRIVVVVVFAEPEIDPRMDRVGLDVPTLRGVVGVAVVVPGIGSPTTGALVGLAAAAGLDRTYRQPMEQQR